MKKTVILLFAIGVVATTGYAQSGVKKKRPLPYEYGRVVISNFSEQAGLPAVEFEHWVHRTKFTCRLCHVDLAFAMKAGGSSIKAKDNAKGFYCGTCHNGKKGADGRTIFGSCSVSWTRDDLPKCQRCHSRGLTVKREYDFDAVTSKFPRERFGNGINWEKAENDGLIKLADEIPGVSIPRPPMATVKDFSISPANQGIPEIIFSHKKHTVWNGCEVCHPEIFIGVKKGTTKYTMVDIYNGKYCGVCHGSVAFPLLDCQRCHIKPVVPS
jgi:c(7)-type cytochrome triheme protein